MLEAFPLRERVQSDLRRTGCAYRWEGDGFVYHDIGSPFYTFRDVHIMRDQIGGSKGKYPRKVIRPCEHTSIIYRGDDLVPFLGDYGLLIKPQNQSPWINSGDVSNMFPAIPDSLWSQLCEEAFIDFSTRFPQSLSFAEFAVGLKDLGDLIPKLQESVTKSLAGGYLNWKFGWENLISDLGTLSGLMDSLQARLKWLRETHGKPTKLGFHRANVRSITIGQELSYDVVRGFATKAVLENYRCDFRAGSTLIQRLEHLDDSIGLFRAFVSALGLNNPLKAAWENLPYSFVVDWFLKISTHLERLATAQPAEEWDVFNISSSFHEVGRFGVFQVNTGIYGGIVNPIVRLGEITFERYVRMPGLPINSSVFQPSNLNPSQLTLLLAMLHS